jgi:hypothetical protein
VGGVSQSETKTAKAVGTQKFLASLKGKTIAESLVLLVIYLREA